MQSHTLSFAKCTY